MANQQEEEVFHGKWLQVTEIQMMTPLTICVEEHQLQKGILKTCYKTENLIVCPRHVVTAAHCLRDDLETVLLGVTLFQIYLLNNFHVQEHILYNDTDGASPEEFKVFTVELSILSF